MMELKTKQSESGSGHKLLYRFSNGTYLSQSSHVTNALSTKGMHDMPKLNIKKSSTEFVSGHHRMFQVKTMTYLMEEGDYILVP